MRLALYSLLSSGLVPPLYFGHDFPDCGAFQPAVTITGVVARAGPIQAEEASQTVQSQFALQNREGMPLEVFIAHLFEGRLIVPLPDARIPGSGRECDARYRIARPGEADRRQLSGKRRLGRARRLPNAGVENAEPKLLKERGALGQA
jgi:hypothetical protein